MPIIMGQNIGTCVTAMISAMGANKNGRRAAMVHLYFNIIGVVVYLALFYVLDAIFNFAFVEQTIGMWGVAAVHTIFKILSVALLAPFYKQMAKLATLTIRDKKGENETINLLDERLLETPAVAVGRAYEVTGIMADVSTNAMLKAMQLADKYDAKLADQVRDLETEADRLEDALGTYLVKLSACSMDEQDSNQVTKLLRVIGDYERISDHAVNIVESIEELESKKEGFSQVARDELNVLDGAIEEILTLTREAFVNEDVRKAAELLVKLAEYKPLAKVEELEEVNLNQIDNVLSNTVPKSEEKREARQAEQERLEELQRIEEEERKRRARGERPSLRARLAAKKAIVAANSAVPQRETQRQVQNEPVKPHIEL
jgi:phosphate:Na+ symporter